MTTARGEALETAPRSTIDVGLKEGIVEKFVQLENVGMVFQTRRGPFVAVKDINLAVRQGEFVSIIGHSGCGKSTLLNMVA